METKTRYIGHCQICEAQFKLNPKAGHTMVHHGFKRPGHGFIVGDCMAVGEPAYEQSCEVLKQYTGGLKAKLANAETYLAKLVAGEVTKLLKEVKVRVTRTVEFVEVSKGEEGWELLLSNTTHATKQSIRWFQEDIARCEARIAAWKLEPLQTVEEAARKVEETKATAQKRVQDKRAQKLAEKIASYQKRIDSALKNHTTSTLATIFEDAPSKLRELTGKSRSELNTAQALALLERDHVWAAFGLIVDGEVTPEAQSIRGKMHYPEFHNMTKYPWPAGL